MKKIALFIFASLLFIACEKEKSDSLANTTWVTSIETTHNEVKNGKSYEYTREIEVVFTDDSKGSFILKEAKLPDDITLEALTLSFAYTYNASSGKGNAVFAPNNAQVPFTVSGNKLKMSATPQENLGVSLEFTKK